MISRRNILAGSLVATLRPDPIVEAEKKAITLLSLLLPESDNLKDLIFPVPPLPTLPATSCLNRTIKFIEPDAGQVDRFKAILVLHGLQEWTVCIKESDTVNATWLDYGHFSVTSGLLRYGTSADVKFALGHEVGHYIWDRQFRWKNLSLHVRYAAELYSDIVGAYTAIALGESTFSVLAFFDKFIKGTATTHPRAKTRRDAISRLLS